jgi:cytochrome oxidase Cu insertion factor (SCO1/SenC/PrrC family)
MKPKQLIIGLIMIPGFLLIASTGQAEGAEKMIAVGQPFVEFELRAHDGTSVSSADLDGRPYLLFFYPKADTPG